MNVFCKQKLLPLMEKMEEERKANKVGTFRD
jgi:hypothetical protein